MGCHFSSTAQHERVKKLCWSMPPYTIEKYEVTQERVELAAASWRYAMSGESETFHHAKTKDSSVTPLVFFYNQFYYFVFELMPETKPMFTRGMKAQGMMLANVIKYLLLNLRDTNEHLVKRSLEHLARVHNGIGVSADAYSLMGMILVQTMRICTGPKFWTDDHANAWIHIYSKMMAVMIPVVISNERPKLGAIDLEAVEFYRKTNLNPEADKSDAPHLASTTMGDRTNDVKNYGSPSATPQSPSENGAAPMYPHYLPTPTAAAAKRPGSGRNSWTSSATSTVTSRPPVITSTTVHSNSHRPTAAPKETPEQMATINLDGTGGGGGGGGCPMVSGGSENDPDASPALQELLKANAAAQLEVLNAKAHADAAAIASSSTPNSDVISPLSRQDQSTTTAKSSSGDQVLKPVTLSPQDLPGTLEEVKG